MKKVGQIFREGLVNRIKRDLQDSESIFLLGYSRVSSTQLTDFRKDLHAAGARINVTKNSMARIALKDLEYADLAQRISDQTAFIYTKEEAPKVSKVLIDFVDKCEGMDIKGGVVDGKILSKEDVKRLSELPSKEVLQAMLLGAIQAPLTRLAGALNAKSRELLSILKQLSEKKGEE